MECLESYCINPRIRVAAKFNILMISEYRWFYHQKVWIAKFHVKFRNSLIHREIPSCALVFQQQARRAWGLDGHFLKVRGALLSHVPFLGEKKNTGFSGDDELVQQVLAGYSWSSIMRIVVLSSIVHLSIRYIGCFIKNGDGFKAMWKISYFGEMDMHKSHVFPAVSIPR